ncbi:hypothetical protein GCM10027613_02210 [Microlunatus endophyticus]
MAASSRGISRTLLPSPKSRAAIAKRMAAVSGEMTTAAVAEMEVRHPWFSELDAKHRSWITLVAQAGIDGFVHWFSSPEPSPPSTADVFGSAPRELARRISLYQTVELVRTTIEVAEKQIDELMPRSDRPVLQAAIVQYSREVAFTAAEIYARAAELRGAWDARLEALVADAVIRGETDESVLSRASALGWRSSADVVVVVGPEPEDETGVAIEGIRHECAKAGVDMLGAVQGDRLLVVLGGDRIAEPEAALAVVTRFAGIFGPGPVVVGPPVEHLADAARSTRAALSGYRAAVGWPNAPGRCSPTICCRSGHCPVTDTPGVPWPARSSARWPTAAAACWRPSWCSWTTTAVWRPPPERCSCTPTRSATGSSGSRR